MTSFTPPLVFALHTTLIDLTNVIESLQVQPFVRQKSHFRNKLERMCVLQGYLTENLDSNPSNAHWFEKGYLVLVEHESKNDNRGRKASALSDLIQE